MSCMDKKPEGGVKRSKAANVLMISTGVAMGVALSFFVIVSKGVKDCLRTLEGLKDNSKE